MKGRPSSPCLPFQESPKHFALVGNIACQRMSRSRAGADRVDHVRENLLPADAEPPADFRVAASVNSVQREDEQGAFGKAIEPTLYGGMVGPIEHVMALLRRVQLFRQRPAQRSGNGESARIEEIGGDPVS